MARCGGFRRHLAFLRRKKVNKNSILKSSSQKLYGAGSYHLLSLVTATNHNIKEYGDAVLNVACATVFKKLEVLQFFSLRVVLGLPKWVLNIALRKHAGFSPVSDRNNVLAFSFWVKYLSLSSWCPL